MQVVCQYVLRRAMLLAGDIYRLTKTLFWMYLNITEGRVNNYNWQGQLIQIYEQHQEH